MTLPCGRLRRLKAGYRLVGQAVLQTVCWRGSIKGLRPIARQRLDFGERGSSRVLRREARLADGPANPQSRIIPAHRAFAVGHIDFRAFVKEICLLGEDTEPMRKARWYPQLKMALLGEFQAYPFPKAGRAQPNIHHHVPD